MSKSLGNVVDPLEIIRDFGTDALRFTVATGVRDEGWGGGIGGRGAPLPPRLSAAYPRESEGGSLSPLLLQAMIPSIMQPPWRPPPSPSSYLSIRLSCGSGPQPQHGPCYDRPPLLAPPPSPSSGSAVGQDLNLNMDRVTANRNFTNKLWNATK